ncbi:phosphate butyryltransferase [Ectobacillus ponti]|uniref:Phosphate butyryltransferase n=1 Tax=Ectobacillus ponti TaxID=2961894 RepID=A0AA41X644_9BACI|nr:phosphate butyryltransferase [Ectobacillus ponti]MCP8967035.1 phosphate butyryltransferase [Ectobacillus ponti]
MKLQTLIDQAARQPKRTVAVAAAADREVLDAVKQAAELGLAKFRLYGKEDLIRELLGECDLLHSEDVRIIDAPLDADAAVRAVQAVRAGEAEVLMKGHIATSAILKAVLNKEYGLRKGSVLSHVAVFEVPSYDRLLLVTDAAMNVAPDLEQKKAILENAAAVARAIGIEIPKAAPIAAVETVNPAMPATVDAALLAQMNRRGQIQGCLVDGPLALDNAISGLAAEHKGITGEVAGRADILLVPNLEAGNILYKSLVYFAHARVGAIVAGATAPIVLTSRADSAEAKVYSLALAVVTASQ